MTKTNLSSLTMGIVLSALSVSPVMAASAKFSAAIQNATFAPVDITNCTDDDDDWQTVLSTTIKTANQKDLEIEGSAQIGLFTQTEVKSKGGAKDSSTAEAQVKVRMLVDGEEAVLPPQDGLAYPPEVTYNARKQTLEAELLGLDCALDDNGNVVCENPEVINLILDTTSAHSFTFVVRNMSSGDHSVEMQVAACTDTDVDNGSADADVSMGPGTLTVEEVRATNNPDGITFE